MNMPSMSKVRHISSLLARGMHTLSRFWKKSKQLMKCLYPSKCSTKVLLSIVFSKLEHNSCARFDLRNNQFCLKKKLLPSFFTPFLVSSWCFSDWVLGSLPHAAVPGPKEVFESVPYHQARIDEESLEDF